MTDFVFVVDSEKGFEDAIISVRRAAEAASWGVLGGYDFSEILASKGFPQESRYRVLDICAPKYANEMLNLDKRIVLCMPCKILVFTDGGATRIAGFRPGMLFQILLGRASEGVQQTLDRIDSEMRSIIESAR